MKKIVHIITNLGSGGAENMLYKLLNYSDKTKYYHEVISLMDKGDMGPKIESIGVKVHAINVNGKNALKSLNKVRSICNSFDVIDTWLYHSDLIGFLVAKILLRKKLIWNIRHSNLNKADNKFWTLKVVKFNSLLSRYVDKITYNSYESKKNHLYFGYSDKNSAIIHNGFDLEQFRYDHLLRIKIRKELGLSDDIKVITTVGRWYIQKDYPTLLKALYELKKKDFNFKMILCGTNLDENNEKLTSLIEKYGLKDYMILLGRSDKIPAILSASDIYVSSSLGESFSNSIGEAMACELPCVVTDVGESRLIVGDTGKVVNAQDSNALSQALFESLCYEDMKINGIKARKRIEENYDIRDIVKKYETEYISL
jgi:glycosyltransferase involved in cell wall biosynthesis